MAVEKPRVSAFNVEVKDGVARLVFDLPGEKINVLRSSVLEELSGVIARLGADREVKCLLVESAKPGVFVAGADLKELAAVADRASEVAGRGQEVMNAIEDLPFPTIAVIDGAALGGGLELALACRWRLASDEPSTSLGLPETTLGIIPGFGGTYRLPRTVGLSQALRMILTGRPVDARRALKMGLVDGCHPRGFLEDKARELAARLTAGKPPERRRRPLSVRIVEGNPVGRAVIFRQARKDVLSKGGAHYPAPGEAIALVRKNRRGSRDAAMRRESEAIGRLAAGPVARNLISIFFMREEAKKLSWKGAHPGLEASPSRKISRAAVLGAGVMGGKIAWLFSKADIPVVMKDISWDAVQKGFESAYGVYKELGSKGRLDARQVNLKMHMISGAVDYGGLGSPDLVIEAVVENLAVKKKVLAEVEGRMGSRAILASNTSSLSITEMAGALSRPDRFLGMHFFNPPNLMPLVEIVPGPGTDPEAVNGACQAALALGKIPIVAADRPGFLVNRLLLPYLNECVRLAEEGADFTEVDRILHGFGWPMGPFRLLDEIGLDVGREVARILHAAYGPRAEPPAAMERLAGRKDMLGRKTGKGFYVYKGKKAAPNHEIRALLAAGDGAGRGARLSPRDILHRPLLMMVNEAARALQEKAVSGPRELDLALILGAGFPPFRGGLLRYADEMGSTRVRDTLAEYNERLGERFSPAPLLESMIHDGKKFHDGAD